MLYILRLYKTVYIRRQYDETDSAAVSMRADSQLMRAGKTGISGRLACHGSP